MAVTTISIMVFGVGNSETATQARTGLIEKARVDFIDRRLVLERSQKDLNQNDIAQCCARGFKG